MGRSSSKFMETPKNPLQELQWKEHRRELRKRQQEKQQKQIAKLQKKQAKKQRSKKGRKSHECSENAAKQISSNAKRLSDAAAVQRSSCLNSQTTSYEINREEFNRLIEQQIQNHLDNDLSTFVMYQVCLSVQFFGNYEHELSIISEELLAKENELNQNLDEHSVLISTPLDAAISKWIQYKPIHGPNKHNPQPLQPLTIYAIFENIDIARPNDANYDSISPLCKVDLDTEFYHTTPAKEDYKELLRATKWKGYVRLKLQEEPKLQRTTATDSEVYTDGSSGYSTASCYSFKLPSRVASNYSAESEYDYAYITHLNAHHPLAELKMPALKGLDSELDAKVLPDTCVSSLAQFVNLTIEEETDGEDYDEDDESTDGDDDVDVDSEDVSEVVYHSAKQRYRDYDTMQAIRAHKLELERRKVLLQQRFLNSKEFMRYFGELVRQKLAERLQLTAEELNEATYRGASIHTKYCELIPAIFVAHNAQHWPDCAFQFRIRERPTSTNPLTGQQFQWPTRSMIRRIETFGYHVIPEGYAPKRQRNPFRELEWRIVFPKAERYLEQSLTSTQVKVFMLTKALVKTFVEPQEKHNKAFMFTTDQLRMHLFWECERNFTAWPEEYLGEVLLRFITSFMQRLRKKCLRDFFIEERNLFESIPEYSLVMLFSIFADIVANPLMHLMVALRNIDTADEFFPKLNYKKLYENLCENNLLRLKLQAKNSRNLIEVQDATLLPQDEAASGLVGMKQHREKIKGKLRRKTHVMRHNIEMKRKQEIEQRRLSEESIDVEFCFRRNLKNSQLKQINQGVENLRRTNILELFIHNLIAMAEKALEFRAFNLAKNYLAQARRLCKFYNSYGCDMGAKEYISTIESIEEEIDALQLNEDSTNHAPTLPMRSSTDGGRTRTAKELNELLESEHRTLKVDVDEITRDSVSTTKSATRRRIDSRSLNQSFNKLLSVAKIQKSMDSLLPDAQALNLIGRNEVDILRSEVSDDKIFQTSLEPYQDHNTIMKCKSNEQIIEISLEDNAEEGESDEDGQKDTVGQGANGATSTTRLGMLHNLKLGKSQIIKELKSSTESLLATISSEEKRLQLRDMVKRKTLQLKDAFIQCSET